MQGTVKWYRKEKGFGFISGEDGKEYFVHFSELPQDADNGIDGKEVTFELEENPRGPKAVKVKLE